MPLATPVLHTTLASRRPDRHGKVRDIYDFGDRLLIVATDRISAFDYVLGIGHSRQGQGADADLGVLVRRHRADRRPTTCISIDAADFPVELATRSAPCSPAARCSCSATEPLPIECVARGYLSGSGWKDYQATGEVCGIRLPAGLRESDRLPEPIFTPGDQGADRPRHQHQRSRGRDAGRTLRVLARARELTLRLYAEGAAHAESRGIIVADTKFEFGLLPDDGRPAGRAAHPDRRGADARLVALLAARRVPARAAPQPSFDKQFVRDYLERIKWNKQPPVPSLPDDVVAKTREKYVEAFRRLPAGSCR